MDSLILSQIALKNYLTKTSSSKKVLVAYSGGLDSHVLLHLISQIPEFTVRAVHIHHGLQAIADSWVPHCQNICDKLNTPFETKYLHLKPKKGESLEALARQGRYQALKATLKDDEILVTAQHQNDQSETLLLQLFRGAGVQGLASMPAVSAFGRRQQQHIRPFLNISRHELEAYAKTHQLEYIDDPSNQDTSFDRNFLRKKILPQLRERWLGLDKALNRSAAIQAETLSILDEIAAEDFINICSEEENTLQIESLILLSYPRQKLLLRYWIAKNGFKYPSEKKLQHIFSNILEARKDAQPLLEWQGVQIRRYKNKLYIMSPLSEHDSTQVFYWDTTAKPLYIPSLDLYLKADILHERNQTVTVLFRQGGELIHSSNPNKKASLKSILSEAGIPPWERSRLPLIYHEDKLIQVIGLKKE